jgi:hypothetical protein
MCDAVAMARLVGMTTTTTTSRPIPTTFTRPRSFVERAALAWSALAAAVGAWWLADPDAFPDYLDKVSGNGSLVTLLEPTVVSTVLVLLGLVGVLAAATLRLLLPIGVTYAVVFGLLATDLSLLVTMGYSTAIFGPPLLFGYLVAASVHRPALRWVVVAVAASAVALVASTGAGASAFAEFGHDIGEGLGRSGVAMSVGLASFIGGALWLLTALRSAGLHRAQASSVPSYVPPRRDWGWWVTVVAALCPLPYASLRMTWLTPWPTIIDPETLSAEPAMRIFGLSLGFAAIGGALLTIGLLMRWGSVYPRWIPAVGGRSVSPVWPTTIAVVVGAAVTVAGRSMLQMTFTEDDVMTKWETMLMLPFPVWGPLLIAAAIAYYRRRTATIRATRDRNVSVV